MKYLDELIKLRCFTFDDVLNLTKNSATASSMLQYYTKQNRIIKVLDMCTGSGAIAISIAKYFQEKNEEIVQKNSQDIKIEVYALDISTEALEIAERNAKTNSVKVTFFKSISL